MILLRSWRPGHPPERELEVVSCIAGGYRNSEIAHQRGDSELGVRDRTQLAVQAPLHGWISLSNPVSDAAVAQLQPGGCLLIANRLVGHAP